MGLSLADKRIQQVLGKFNKLLSSHGTHYKEVAGWGQRLRNGIQRLVSCWKHQTQPCNRFP